MRKLIIAVALTLSATTASAVDCGAWWMGGGCQPGVGSAPSNYIWNPLWGDGQVIGANAGTFGIAAVASGLASIVIDAVTPSNSIYQGAGAPTQQPVYQASVSSSGAAMYQRKDVYDPNCNCVRSMLVQIQ